jgi:hypothetical protein
MEKQVQLGDEVQCVVTGFRGVAIAISEYLHGCRRVSVQPPVGSDGKVPESYDIDEPALKITKKGKVVPALSEPEEISVDLGDEARDPISGAKGVVAGRATHFNGCVRFLLQLGLNKDGEWQNGVWIDGPRLEVIKAKKQPVGKRSTGGPMARTASRALG